MFKFDYIDDTELVVNYELRDQILDIIDQKSIFELVFGKLNLNHKVTSPFRKDRNPGCYFYYFNDGSLRFVDWANTNVIRGIKMQNIDCFEAVQIYFDLETINDAYEFIYDTIVNNKECYKTPGKVYTLDSKQHVETKIYSEFRPFQKRDVFYWNKYGITIDQLQEDFVFPVSRYSITKTDTTWYRPKDICYSLGLFNGQKQKLYFPKRKDFRFLTNCNQNDIGMINNLPDVGRQLVISKSYKDYRVLTNFGCTCIWFQNEVTCPSDHILIDLINRFQSITVFFDNDPTGIRNSQQINQKLISLGCTSSRPLWINTQNEFVTDPSDLYNHSGPTALQSFLSQQNIIS